LPLSSTPTNVHLLQYNLISWPNQSPLQKSLWVVISSRLFDTTPQKLVTFIYSPVSGTSAIQPGNIYNIHGHLIILDDDTTYALTFHSQDATPVLQSPNDNHQTRFLIDTVGTIASVSFSTSLIHRGVVQLEVGVTHKALVRKPSIFPFLSASDSLLLFQYGQTIQIDYTFAPNRFTLEFAQ
jgi:hypothetical protein